MKEIDIIKHAKSYMDMLSKGINPISKEKYPKNSDINNERLSKCFEFVSGILEKVITETEEDTKKTVRSNEEKTIESNEEKNIESNGEKMSHNGALEPDEKKASLNVNIKEEKAEINQSPNDSQDYGGFVNTLVSDDVEGDDVVELLISKGVLKQGFSKNV